MKFAFDEDIEGFRREIRQFVKDEYPPGHIEYSFAEESDDELWEAAMQSSKKLAKKGWLTISWPNEYGGMAAPFWQQMVFKEEVGYWGILGTGMGVSGTEWIGPSIMAFGSEKQKKTYLPLIASGHEDGVWCTGYSEPDAGSDMANMQTRAEKKKGVYIINGQKVWNSAGHRARWCWLACRTDPEAKRKHDGLSIMIVDMKSPGVTVRPIGNIVGYNYFNEIFFSNVVVPEENIVGRENNGWAQLMQALSFERGLAMGYSGKLRRAFDELLMFAKEEGLLTKSAIRLKLADLLLDIKTLRILAYEAAWKVYNGQNVIYEPCRDKAYSDELFEKFGMLGSQIMGAFSEVDPLHRNCRWTRIKSVVEGIYWGCPGFSTAAGTTDNMKNIVAQFGLGLPKAY
jgi:alkylation response protein AidB-like acyl-CoA dehydrogenase